MADELQRAECLRFCINADCFVNMAARATFENCDLASAIIAAAMNDDRYEKFELTVFDEPLRP